MSTAARVLTLNCRNENAMELFPSRRWSRRRPYLIEFIKDCAPSVIGVQECTNNMAAEITEGLGPNWTFWGSGTAKIIWDSTKWVALDQFQAGLPYTVLGITKQRPITMLKLQSIKTRRIRVVCRHAPGREHPERGDDPAAADEASDHLDRAAT
jgi:hypothetical protein